MSAPALAPRPGAAPQPPMDMAQAGLEHRKLLRNGEQLLLTLAIPLALLVGLCATDVVDLGVGAGSGAAGRVDLVLPGVLALAVVSTAFTGQAIATGFERRYGVLKRLGATPLPRAGLLAGKALAVLAVEVLQVVVLGAVALALGWSPPGPAALAGVLLLLLLATAASTGLALLLAGTLRAEAVLAAANLLWLVMAALGGVVVPLARYPEALQGPLALLPLGALSEGLREVLAGGAPAAAALVLAVWALLLGAAAARWFRWE